MSNIEDKISKTYFSISEVAEIVELKPYVLRYWEKEFKDIKPIKNNVGVRRYTKEDIELILVIKELLYTKQFTIKGAKSKLIADKEKRSFMKADNSEVDSQETLIELKNKILSLIKLIDDDQ